MESLAVKGRLIAVGYMDGINNVEIDFRKVHANRFSLHGVSNAKVGIDDIKETVNGFKSLILPALEKREIEPIIDKVFDFDSINEARIHMMTNKQIGKIVVKL
jgi:NADPH2:quinone reductase